VERELKIVRIIAESIIRRSPKTGSSQSVVNVWIIHERSDKAVTTPLV
jgi:hypothetical protein